LKGKRLCCDDAGVAGAEESHRWIASDAFEESGTPGSENVPPLRPIICFSKKLSTQQASPCRRTAPSRQIFTGA
jgi:hypothetical protein